MAKEKLLAACIVRRAWLSCSLKQPKSLLRFLKCLLFFIASCSKDLGKSGAACILILVILSHVLWLWLSHWAKIFHIQFPFLCVFFFCYCFFCFCLSHFQKTELLYLALCQNKFDHVGWPTRLIRREIQNLELKFEELDLYIKFRHGIIRIKHCISTSFTFLSNWKRGQKTLTWFPAEFHGLLLFPLFCIRLFYIKADLALFTSASWFLNNIFFFSIEIKLNSPAHGNTGRSWKTLGSGKGISYSKTKGLLHGKI